jgi:hypothetical protein
LLLIGLLFVGPALAAQRLKTTVFAIAELSLGRIPALLFRLGCTVYLALLSFPILSTITELTIAPPPMGYSQWSWAHAGVGVSLSLVLAGTSVVSLRTNARLALFTNKLALATMIAALIRVRGNLPESWAAFTSTASLAVNPTHALDKMGYLLLYSAPLVFLAAVFAHRSQSPRCAVQIGIWGAAVPFVAAVFLSGFVDRAAHLMYRNFGNINPYWAALLGGDARAYYPAKKALILITLFGVVRFAAWAIAEALPLPREKKWARRAILGCVATGIGVACGSLTLDLIAAKGAAACVVVAGAAVLSADYLTGRWRRPGAKTVDWVGLSAWLAGAGILHYRAWTFVFTGIYLGPDQEVWWHSWWILPTYGISFVVCMAGRLIERHSRHVQLKTGEDLGA